MFRLVVRHDFDVQLMLPNAIFILNPLRPEQPLPRRRCYIKIGLIWTMCGLFSASHFNVDIRWNVKLCSTRIPKGRDGAILLMSGFVIGVVIPGIAIVYSTVRIFIVVVRTHRQISALERSIIVKMGNAGLVTVQAMLSAKNTVIICLLSVALNI